MKTDLIKYTLLLFLTLVFSFAISGCERRHGEFQESSSSAIVTGNSSQSELYQVGLSQHTVPVDEPTAVKVVVRPGKDLKINQDFPWKVDFDPVDGISLPVASFSKEDIRLEDDQATIPLLIHAQNSGEVTLDAVADFSVCNDDRCDIMRQQPITLQLKAVPNEGAEK